MAPGLLSKIALIDEKEYAYPQPALQAFPWRFDPGRELVHEEHQGDCCNGGRPFGQWQSARTKQRPLPSGAGLLGRDAERRSTIGLVVVVFKSGRAPHALQRRKRISSAYWTWNLRPRFGVRRC